MTRSADHAVEKLTHDLLERYPEEAGRQLESSSERDIELILSRVPVATAARVLTSLTSGSAAAVLERMDASAAAGLLRHIDPAHVAMLVGRLGEESRRSILGILPAAEAEECRSLMSYAPDVAGHLMEPRATAFPRDASCGEVLTRLRKLRNPRIRDVFLVDSGNRLTGAATVLSIAIADPHEKLETLAAGPAVSVRATAGRDEVVEQIEKFKLSSLPVVDFEGRLLGVIRHDALVEAAREAATADIQSMVGASKEERALSKVSFAVRKRLPWLEINLVTAFLAAAVVGLFEGLIAKFTALAVLLPVVAGQSGNTGAQALAVTMRGLSLREIRTRQWLRVATKEVGTGFINGCAIALTTALAVYLWSGSTGLTLVIGISMVISMIAAALAGAIIPVALTAIGQDPAQSSSIILTTVTDVCGFFSFLGVATMLAPMI